VAVLPSLAKTLNVTGIEFVPLRSNFSAFSIRLGSLHGQFPIEKRMAVFGTVIFPCPELF
jgi:hypothetical protein